MWVIWAIGSFGISQRSLPRCFDRLLLHLALLPLGFFKAVGLLEELLSSEEGGGKPSSFLLLVAMPGA